MEVDKITKEYAKKITNRIQTYKELIIESFVEFYGENYKKIIIDRFNDISFLYYINDVTIFYIVDSLKQGHEEKLKNIIFIMPYFAVRAASVAMRLIFKKKCTENILEDNIMKDVFHVKYTDYHYLISEFYEKNKNSIKSSYIDSNTPQLDKQDFEYLSNLFKSHRTK